ncbi:MAG: hypothetical protein ACQER4_07475 [Bacteroidota bacterium]
MNRFRNSLLTGSLGLLLAVVVLVQLVAPSSEQARMTTFAQWLDRSLPGETSPPWTHAEERDRTESILQLQQWLINLERTHATEEESSKTENGAYPLSWPASGWILQAWSDYNEMSDGMQATVPDRPTTSGKWILQEIFPNLSSREAGSDTVRPIHSSGQVSSFFPLVDDRF